MMRDAGSLVAAVLFCLVLAVRLGGRADTAGPADAGPHDGTVVFRLASGTGVIFDTAEKEPPLTGALYSWRVAGIEYARCDQECRCELLVGVAVFHLSGDYVVHEAPGWRRSPDLELLCRNGAWGRTTSARPSDAGGR